MAAEFDIEYFGRWNERIVKTTDALSGSGAISEIISSNLAPNKLLVSDASGKIIVSSLVTTGEAETLAGIDTGQTIQDQLDSKQDTLTLGDLTESTSSVLTITGGSGSIIGSGLTIQVKLAATSQSGYLSSTDWNTFNNKISPTLNSGFVLIGNGSNVATAFDTATGDITASTSTGLTIKAGVIVNADVNASAAIARTKIASGTNYRILANNGSGVFSENAAITASRAVAADSNGQLVASATTALQLGYSSTLTGDIQVQIDNKIATQAVNAIVKAPTATEDGFALTWDDGAQEYTLTDPVVQGIPTGGSTRQFLGKNSGTNYDSSWLSLVLGDLNDITALAADVNVLDGADAALVTPTIIGYLGTANPLSSPIQDQLDGKQSSSLAQNAIWVGDASNIASQLSSGTNGYVLTSVSGVPQWQPASIATSWALATGGTLTGVNTITSNANGQLNFNGTWTATGGSQYHLDFSGTLTGSSTVSHALSAYRFSPSITAGANSQDITAITINPVLATGGFTGVVRNLLKMIHSSDPLFTFDTSGRFLVGDGGGSNIAGHISTSSVNAYSSGTTSDLGLFYYGGTNATNTTGHVFQIGTGNAISGTVGYGTLIIAQGNFGSSSENNRDIYTYISAPTYNYTGGATSIRVTGFSHTPTRTSMTNVTEYAYVSNGGAWGNGTLTPTHQLHIVGTANNQNLLLIEENGGSNILEIIETGGVTAIGFFGVSPVAQATALTTALTQITHTAPGAPDYALQDLTNIGGFGFVTQDEGNTLLSVVRNLQIRVDELEGRLQDYGLLA